MKHLSAVSLVLGLTVNIIMCTWFLSIRSSGIIELEKHPLRRDTDLISSLKALKTDLQRQDVELIKNQFEEISKFHCQLAAEIADKFQNQGVLCQNEKTQSTSNLSISEQNAGLRSVLLADDADGVAADASISPPEKLAAALEWTRRREQGLLDQVKRHALERARFSAANKIGVPTLPSQSNGSKQLFAASPWPKDSRTCDGDSPAFRTLLSSEGSFEGGMQDGPRIDGITQQELIQFKYHVSMCQNAGGLKGIFRIHKLRDCDETVHITDDAEISRVVKEQFGPDEFTLNLIGPEMHSLNPQMKYRGGCR